jgi:hypothetical protein
MSMQRGRVLSHAVVLAVILLVAAPAHGSTVTHGQSRAAIARLKAQYPDVIVQQGGAGDRTLIGPMSVGRSPGAAAGRWMADHAEALGVSRKDLRVDSESPAGKHFGVARFHQTMDGLPVENSDIRVISLRGPRESRVVSVSSRVVAHLDGIFASDRVMAAAALESVRSRPRHAGLTLWTTPELVVFAGDDAPIPPVRAWKFSGSGEAAGKRAAFTFFVDAATGETVRVRDILLEGGPEPRYLHGKIQAYATHGTLPDTTANPEVKGPLFDVRARDQLTGEFDFTDASGLYFIPISGFGPGHVVESDLIGEWVQVFNAQGDEFHFESSSTSGDFNYNTARDEFGTAQINAFIHTTNAHDLFAAYQPQFTGLDLTIAANANIDDVCNAYFDPVESSINFFNAGEGEIGSPASVVFCENSAYSSIITHEYGHFAHWQLGVESGGPFSEGYADSLAVLTHDDAQIGRDGITYINTGQVSPYRDIEAADKQFPCTGEEHECGQVLAGIWWDISQALQSVQGPVAGLDEARDLFTTWSLVTLGPDGGQSAGQRTAVEILTVDDNDGDLCTPTPHSTEICASLEGHNIACPQSDCNENTEIDACDIQSGYSNDCNENVIPDSCELASGAAPDCNANQVPDSCDIAAGLNDCCGVAGVPDVCEQCFCTP